MIFFCGGGGGGTENLWGACVPPGPRRADSSELRKFSHFHILKLLFPSTFCWYIVKIYFKVSNYICIFLHRYIQSMQFPFITYGMAQWYKRQYTDKTLRLRESIYMWASELRNFLYSNLKLLFFPCIFCWYFRYFVGTNDMLVDRLIKKYVFYRQISKCTDKTPRKHYGGGGGGEAIAAIAPCPPSGYANGYNNTPPPPPPEKMGSRSTWVGGGRGGGGSGEKTHYHTQN